MRRIMFLAAEDYSVREQIALAITLAITILVIIAIVLYFKRQRRAALEAIPGSPEYLAAAEERLAEYRRDVREQGKEPKV